MHTDFAQAHFLHRSQALLTLLLSFSSLLLFADGTFWSPEPVLFGVTTAVASMLLAGVHAEDPRFALLAGEHPWCRLPFSIL